jgi:hypothetical protein
MAKTGPKIRSTEHIIAQARAVHGDRYDYSRVEYKKAGDKVLIICPEHGEFWQPAIQHLRGAACRACVYNRFRMEQDEFIEEARKVHGDKYDYSATLYASVKEAVEIKCPKHGIFHQRPPNHLKGIGCRKCYLEKIFAPRPKQFLENARQLHGDKFDYSLVVYKDSQTRVTIICPNHGSFEQTPSGHLNTNGCPACGQEVAKSAVRLDWIERAKGRTPTLYFLKMYSENEVFYKVGVTFVSVAERYNRGRDLAGYQYEVLAQHISANAAAVYDWEQSILETFSSISYRPKRDFGGATECFSSADEILAIFPL